MILHASIVADDPQAAAATLARLLGGVALAVGPGQGSWSAVGPDPVGNLISILPRGSEFHRTGDHVDIRRGNPVRHSAFHLLIETPLSEPEVVSLAQDSGCTAHPARHGAFDVIEFWVDDCLLLEVVTPELARRYRATIQSPELRQSVLSGGEAGHAIA